LRFYFSLIIMLLLLFIAFIFGSQNNQVLTLNYLIAQTEITVAMAVSIFTSIGFFIGLLFSLLWRFYRVLKRKKTAVTA
jgi:lipopolysaccharide assembly protein A